MKTKHNKRIMKVLYLGLLWAKMAASFMIYQVFIDIALITPAIVSAFAIGIGVLTAYFTFFPVMLEKLYQREEFLISIKEKMNKEEEKNDNN